MVLLGHGQEIWLEGGEFEGSLWTRVPRRYGRHCDSREGVVGGFAESFVTPWGKGVLR